MATNIPSRKVVELNLKLDSLGAEFKDWHDKSGAMEPLRMHHSQIRRVTCRLSGFEEGIREVLNGDPRKVLASVRSLELKILELHRVWEFFRSKLVLRSVDWFNRYLTAADELAYACYHAAQLAAVEGTVPRDAVKEPPLVFFNGGSSPFTRTRSISFPAEEVLNEEIVTEGLLELLRHLPIPVIGVPWYQVQHLPDSLVIAHEVGHDILADFNLARSIEAALKGRMENRVEGARQPAWLQWSEEIFADVFGVLAAGPAYVGALVDFLATDVSAVSEESRSGPDWGAYPTSYLRVLICLEVASRLGFEEESERLRKEWAETYGSYQMREFADDIPMVVGAILDGPHPSFKGSAVGGALTSVLTFTPENQRRAVEDASEMLRGRQPETRNVRVLFAAGQLAFQQDAASYKERGVHQAILDRIPEIQDSVVRAAPPAASSSPDESDKIAGRELFQRLFSASSGRG